MIKKREYKKALKIVKEYEQQVLNKPVANTFGFIWWCEKDIQHNRWIKAKDIDSACRKFILNQPKTIRKLDYEVQHGDEFIDISERKEFKYFI